MAKDDAVFEPVLDDDNFIAGFSSKFGGVSKGVYKGLNLGLHIGDEISAVLENREILRANLGAKKLVFMEQIHSNNVTIIDDLKFLESENLGEFANPKIYKNTKTTLNLPKCDAIITNLQRIAIAVMVADCMPVLVVGKHSVAAIHAGRVGLMKYIVSKSLNLMKERFGESEFRVFVGPFIGGNCYEIGNLNLGEFERFKKDNKFSLKKALLSELKSFEKGIISLEISDICSHCDERFYSYRKDAITGRFAGVVMIK
ncbi:MAG: polyphenol oxidase family protein [Campylobacter sp.]|nr:polyphenol oxidase family protein [Campylobacter sp.]